MNNPIKSLLITIASSFLLVGCCTQRNVTANQWEYKIASPTDFATPQVEKFLNDMGKDGWVLVQMTESTYFFKRAKK